MDAYVAALEAKLAEVSGIKVNQMANAASEGAAIAEATDYIKNITVQKQGEVNTKITQKWIFNVFLGSIRSSQPLN